MILAPSPSLWTPGHGDPRVPWWQNLFAGGVQRSPTTGGLKRRCADGAVIHTTIDAPPCGCPTYRKARRCSDSVYVDLWWKEIFTPPYFFSKSGVNYYVDSTSTSSSTPGTVLAGETARVSCATTCTGCGAQPTPLNWTATVSGVTLRTGGAYSLSGSANGTWTLPQEISTSPCLWRLFISPLVVTGSITGSGIVTGNYVQVSKDFFGPGVSDALFSVVTSSADIFSAWRMTTSTTLCNATQSGSNSETGTAVNSVGSGGSVTVVPSLSP